MMHQPHSVNGRYAYPRASSADMRPHLTRPPAAAPSNASTPTAAAHRGADESAAIGAGRREAGGPGAGRGRAGGRQCGRRGLRRPVRSRAWRWWGRRRPLWGWWKQWRWSCWPGRPGRRRHQQVEGHYQVSLGRINVSGVCLCVCSLPCVGALSACRTWSYAWASAQSRGCGPPATM